MKKILTSIAVVLALLVTVDANAQFGIIGGFTSSKTSVDKDLSGYAKSTSLYHAGIAYRADMGLIAIQPSLTYQMKGGALEGGLSAVTGTLQTQTGFLELGIGLQVVPLNLGVVKAYGFAEPFIGYGITNVEAMGTDIKGLISGDKAIKDWANTEKNKLEYGFGLGIGVMALDFLQISAQWFTNLGGLYGDNDKIDGSAISDAAKVAFKNGNYQGIKFSLGIFF